MNMRAALSLCWKVLLFLPLCPHACEPSYEYGAAVGGIVDFSNMGMDCYNYRVITPMSSSPTPYTVYTIAVCLPLCSATQLFSLLTYYVFVGGHSLSLCLSGNL